MAIAILAFSILTLLPGAWLTFGLPLDEVSWPARLALGAALSPAILGVQLLALKFFGLPFEQAAWLILILNLPSLMLIVRHWPRWSMPRWSATTMGGAALFSLLAGYVLLPWTLIQNYRPFAWHALWHTDIVYAFTRATVAPEEPELAGLTLDYGWLGHAYWGIVGWATNLPPTVTYAISNLIWLLIAFVLAYELIRRGLGLQSSAALLGTGLLFLGTNIIGASAWLWAHDMFRWKFYLGDIRYTPFLSKYLGFETMPFAFALVIGLAFVCLLGLRQSIKALPAILTALLTALGLIYPILFPIGCLLVGGTLFLAVTKLAVGLPDYGWRTWLWLAFGMVVSSLIFLAFMLFVTQDRTNSVAQLSTHYEMLAKSFQIMSALAPLGLVALPFMLKFLWKRNGQVLLLAATSLALMMMYVLFNLSDLEYKYILGATIMLAPLSAAGLDQLFFRQARSRWVWALVIPVALAATNQALMVRTGAQVPDNRVNAPRINEQSFWLTLNASEPDAAWTAAVRDLTPANTIVVTADSHIHLGPFVNRSLYLPSDSNGENTTGYSVDNRFNLLEWRGYPVNLYTKRQQVAATIFQATNFQAIDPRALTAALQALLALNRPIAIHFTALNLATVSWLKQQGVGEQLFANPQSVVWLIDPTTQPAKALENQGLPTKISLQP